MSQDIARLCQRCYSCQNCYTCEKMPPGAPQQPQQMFLPMPQQRPQMVNVDLMTLQQVVRQAVADALIELGLIRPAERKRGIDVRGQPTQ